MKKTIRVVGCVMRHEDKILILLRSEVETEPSRWGIPAGKVENGETDIQAAIREIFEETGVKLSENQLEYLGHLPIDYGAYLVEFPIFYVSFDTKPNIVLDQQEHIDLAWMRPREALVMPDLMKDVDVILQKFCIDQLKMK